MRRVVRRRHPKIALNNAVIPIIGVNVLFFIFQFMISGFNETFSLSSAEIFTKPWILLTSMFMHGSLFHIFINMYILFIFGTLIERRVGTRRFLFIYSLSGILASLGFVLFQELVLGTSGMAVGASGAIMGIIGLTIILMPDLRVLLFFFIPMTLRTAGIIFVLFEIFGLIYTKLGGSIGIANSAHLVGLVCGFIYGYYLKKKKGSFRRRKKHSRDYQDSIVMNDEDIDNYIRYGKI